MKDAKHTNKRKLACDQVIKEDSSVSATAPANFSSCCLAVPNVEASLGSAWKYVSDLPPHIPQK